MIKNSTLVLTLEIGLGFFMNSSNAMQQTNQNYIEENKIQSLCQISSLSDLSEEETDKNTFHNLSDNSDVTEINTSIADSALSFIGYEDRARHHNRDKGKHYTKKSRKSPHEHLK